MTPEKEMQAFCELIRINTARIHERLDSLYGNPGRGEKLEIAKYAVVMAWEQRGQYAPSEAWITWFGKAVTLAAYYWDIRGGIKFTPQAGQLLHKVGEGTLLFDPYSKKGKRREAQVEFAFGCSGAVIAGELILQASLPVAHPERWAQEAEKPPHRYERLPAVLALSVLRWLAAGQRSRYLYPCQDSPRTGDRRVAVAHRQEQGSYCQVGARQRLGGYGGR